MVAHIHPGQEPQVLQAVLRWPFPWLFRLQTAEPSVVAVVAEAEALSESPQQARTVTVTLVAVAVAAGHLLLQTPSRVQVVRHQDFGLTTTVIAEQPVLFLPTVLAEAITAAAVLEVLVVAGGRLVHLAETAP
jgi:hypothetical protein